MFTGCGCSLGFGASAYLKLWSREVILTTRMSCFEMAREELDMLILGQLDVHCSCRSTDQLLEEVSVRSHVAILYYFRGVRVCKKRTCSCML